MIRSKIEREFLTQFGLDSFDELHPRNFPELEPNQAKKITRLSNSAAPVPPNDLDKQVADAAPTRSPTAASDILSPFINIHINYAARRKTSSFNPSCLMMDYVNHVMNDYLVDDRYFKREAPSYHPYILRLYYGVLFWIQCLRANLETRTASSDDHQFLVRFLDYHPLQSLPIAGPLLPLFKTLCASEPEIKNFGKVVPALPPDAGPCRRDHFMSECPPHFPHFFLPNIPGIFALLEDLNCLINGQNPCFPAKGKHIPVTATAKAPKVFGHHKFPVLRGRSDFEKFALCSPGLQYACEADKKLNESFAERYDYFEFPHTAAADDLRSIANFLHLGSSMVWFNNVKLVAAVAATYFTGSGTLADCAPFGINSNQYVAVLKAPSDPIEPPQESADKRALFPFAFHLTTTVRNPVAMVEAMAAMAQTHIQMFCSHPYLGCFGHPYGTGPFWDIRPDEKSEIDESSYLALAYRIQAMFKRKHSR